MVIKDIFVVPLAHRLIAAGFVVVGESALVHSGPRLYVDKGKWWLYTGGRAIPLALLTHLLKEAGEPN